VRTWEAGESEARESNETVARVLADSISQPPKWRRPLMAATAVVPLPMKGCGTCRPVQAGDAGEPHDGRGFP